MSWNQFLVAEAVGWLLMAACAVMAWWPYRDDS